MAVLVWKGRYGFVGVASQLLASLWIMAGIRPSAGRRLGKAKEPSARRSSWPRRFAYPDIMLSLVISGSAGRPTPPRLRLYRLA
ncbi:hypothetical protein HPP92_025739 [Vanilla planifolia]|uniref:Uncharacterized protein n=1 Tax=Vanilla planifolia TaxID=51239 RepID=A0A835UAW4_VANPL|nr:hypothetical protein HPP92_025739 [Vanilla planifolia]